VLCIDEVEAQACSIPDLSKILTSLWASCSTDIGRVKIVEPIDIQIEHPKPLPSVSQYLLKAE
jgi:hypothetical protein